MSEPKAFCPGGMNGVDLIKAERMRQVTEEGWTEEHDKAHHQGELAWAAVCYAAPGGVYRVRIAGDNSSLAVLDPWPYVWGREHDKRKRHKMTRQLAEPTHAERIRELVKAGALIAAEIDRLQAISAETE